MNDQTQNPKLQAPAINFYHLTATPLEAALPKLLEKAVSGNYRVLLVGESEQRLQQMDNMLWTYDPDSFLPHGMATDARAREQPILLSDTLEPVNGANLLVVTDGRALPENVACFERVIDIFDGKDGEMVSAARQRWAEYKKYGYELSYFQQTEHGGWQKKA